MHFKRGIELMAIMKQIDECLTRAFYNHPPLKKKWQCIKIPDPYIKGSYFYKIYHYHHLILVYRTHTHTFLHEWWERPADKRGLDSAKEWIEEWRRKQQENPS
jgi:hypothetical protein